MGAPLVHTTVLIDDSDIDLFIQRRFLEVYNFSEKLITYNSADEALRKLQNGITDIPDLIFLDLNMPEIDGFGFLEKFNDLPELIKAKTKIVVLTSSNSRRDREQSLSYSQVIHFITKPLKQTDIESLKALLVTH
ncbi:MAG: response regulator [Flammeovirgaceae bacterium]|nr:response regulator [Flammeovirgaceae bacterium]